MYSSLWKWPFIADWSLTTCLFLHFVLLILNTPIPLVVVVVASSSEGASLKQVPWSWSQINAVKHYNTIILILIFECNKFRKVMFDHFYICVCSQVPVFIQIQHKWRRMYAGECQGPGLRTDFEMVHLRKVPSQYNHLAGLLDVFKSKIVSAVKSEWFIILWIFKCLWIIKNTSCYMYIVLIYFLGNTKHIVKFVAVKKQWILWGPDYFSKQSIFNNNKKKFSPFSLLFRVVL